MDKDIKILLYTIIMNQGMILQAIDQTKERKIAAYGKGTQDAARANIKTLKESKK